jgi:hypothetical protein
MRPFMLVTDLRVVDVDEDEEALLRLGPVLVDCVFRPCAR